MVQPLLSQQLAQQVYIINCGHYEHKTLNDTGSPIPYYLMSCAQAAVNVQQRQSAIKYGNRCYNALISPDHSSHEMIQVQPLLPLIVQRPVITPVVVTLHMRGLRREPWNTIWRSSR